MPKITDTEINIKLPGGTRGIKGHPGPVGPIGPQGEPGVQGNKGIVGPKGEVGEIPTFSIGSMTIGTPASITTTGTPENNILNLVIPKGQKGDAPDSPEISFSKSGKKTTMTVDIGDTTKTYEIDDGVDPSVSVSKTGNDTTITTNMYGVSKSTVVPDGEHQFTAGEGISIENREVSDTNYDYIYGDATQEHSGTSFVIEKGLEAPIDSIELKGDTYQYTTTQSKNLLNNTFRQGSESSTSVANYIFSNNASLLQSGTYTFSNNLDNSFQYAIFGTVNNFPNSDTKVYNSGWKTGNTTFTISQTLYVGILIRKTNLSNLTPSTVSSNQFQIETGSSATSYVPFVPNSPSPDYPQNIEVVTGEQEISVVGKNLLNTNTFVKGRIDPANGNIQYPDRITDFSTTDNSITFTSNATWIGVASDFIPITVGNYYYRMSVSTTSSRLYAYVDYYDNEYNYISRLGNYSYVNGDTKTWLLSLNVQNASFIRIHYEMNQIGTTTITNPQLEKGNDTTYEAYKGNTYEINLGKNLFDINTMSATGGMSYTVNNNVITLTGTGSWARLQKTMQFKPNTSYTLMGYVKGTTGARAGLLVANLSQSYQKYSIDSASSTGNRNFRYVNFDTSESTELRIQLYGNWSGTSLNTTTTFENIMIVEGTYTSEIPYSPYRSYTKNLFGDTIRQGVTNYQTGEYSSNNSRITSTDWTTLEAGTYTINVESTLANPLQISCVTFDTSGNFYNISGVSGQWKTFPLTFTTPIPINWKCNLSYSNGALITPSNVKNIQLEKGSQKTSYVPYMSQIELCKIGNYQDYIKRSSGKNLFDKNTMTLSNTSVNPTIGTANGFTSVYAPCKPNRTYTISKAQETSRFYVATTTTIPTVGMTATAISSSTTGTAKTITTGDNANYIIVMVRSSSDTLTEQQIIDGVMIEQSSTTTPYEPYGTGWYICKNIGKVVLNGSDTTFSGISGTRNTGYSRFYVSVSNPLRQPSNVVGKVMCNRLIAGSLDDTYLGNEVIASWDSGDRLYLYINDIATYNLNNANTWLQTHNIVIYYALATPTYIGIEDEELIDALESIWTVDGINNINIATSYLPAYAKITSYNKNANGMLSSIIKMTEILEERSNN